MERTALITGASRGIGAATAARLGGCGFHVIVNYRSDESAARAVVQEIEKVGGTAEAIQADVREPAEVARLVAAATRIDLLVCNANIAPTFAPLSMMSWADFAGKVTGELAAVFHVTQRVLELMREQRSGQIVYVSSVVADMTMPNAISHATAKAALNTFARQVAAEAGHYGVTANTIAPGMVRTEASSAARTPTARRASPRTPYSAGSPNPTMSRHSSPRSPKADSTPSPARTSRSTADSRC
ncbi:SDR family NAD(P)-dependent oxidoreductase [Actinomadura yumaensis]|uniref:SDR family NAD(P)-dependent oxidoreductase n=1 Tax=Actinomadura yumaensis TaxID=111807 RepID=UPI00361B7F91